MAEQKNNSGTNVKQKDHIDLNEPKQFNVVIHNDNFTPMDFVVLVLMLVFNKPQDEATSLMLKVHRTGKAVAGSYSYDIAMSKIDKATTLARDNKYPLRFSCQEA